jgi:hypothetical protein
MLLPDYLTETTDRDTYWKALLSTGYTVVQDDSKGSMWLNLGKYLRENPDIGIAKLGVHHDGRCYYVPELMWGYYFSMGLLQGVGGYPMDYYVLGWQEPESQFINCIWLQIPDLAVVHQFAKTIKECYEPALLLNPTGLTMPEPVL